MALMSMGGMLASLLMRELRDAGKAVKIFDISGRIALIFQNRFVLSRIIRNFASSWNRNI
jgi:surfactin synthase thioesterase subunit